MINISSRGWIYRICGIDNGTNTMGVIISDHHLKTGESDIIFAKTITADRTAYLRHPGIAQNRGKLEARIEVLKPFVRDIFEEFDPDVVGIESPFSHIGVHAYTTLLMSMIAVADEAYEHRSTMDFIKVSPGKAKVRTCPPGKFVTNGPNKTTKEDIRRFILANPKISSSVGINLEELDEHCIDGISVEQYLAWEASRAFR